ncbi:MAG: FHA domain-containing protein [Planctomycetes bacterium]|nr:FHA domain-containing protein [Planctomycetota bacterium]
MSGEKLSDLIAETMEMEEDAFLGEHAYPFLIRERTTGSVPIPGTGQRRTARLTRSALPAAGDGFMEAESEVTYHRVFPRRDDTESVIIGREGGDLQILDGSISAQHAEFTLGFDEDDEEVFSLTDLDSANGTFINGERLSPGEPVELSDMDSIRLGPVVKLQFFSATGFFQFLSMYRRIRRP